MAKLPGVEIIQKQLPKASNLTGAAIVGIGSYSVARFLDNLIGNRIQSIGINLPFVGRLSVLDALMILSFKGTMRKNSMVAAAFAGDKIFNLGGSILGFGAGGNTPTETSGTPGGGF